jgi:hypothetical protein
MDFLQDGFSGKKKDGRIPVCLQTNRIPFAPLNDSVVP